jgi:biopolymer transport protein ExbD
MTPMMNILIILISFLVTMVVFTHLSVIKFELPSEGSGIAPSPNPVTTEPSKKELTLVIGVSGFRLLGSGLNLEPIPKGREGYDFVKLTQSLKEMAVLVPGQSSMIFLIEPTIAYQDIIATMDVSREQGFPDILLSGGFAQ